MPVETIQSTEISSVPGGMEDMKRWIEDFARDHFDDLKKLNTILSLVSGGFVEIPADGALPGANGNWRWYHNGTDLILQHKVSGTWTSKDIKLLANGTVLLGDVDGTDYTTVSTLGGLLLPAGEAAAGKYPIKFQAGTALTTPETGVLEFHNNRLYVTNKSVRKALDRTSDVKLSTTTVASTTTETEVYEALVPANSWVAGNVLKMLMSGTLSNKVGSDGHTVTVKVYSGTDEIATITSTAAKFTDVCWHISGCAIVRDVGATGHMAYHIDMVIDGDNSTVTCDVAEIDTTGALDITVTATWASADAANIFTCDMGIMEYKN